MKEIIEPILAKKLNKMIVGKGSFTDKEYQNILQKLWKEYKVVVKDNKTICKKRDKIVEELNDW